MFMNWVGTPVWRVPFNKFVGGPGNPFVLEKIRVDVAVGQHSALGKTCGSTGKED
jgi:hypothetical protein